MLFITADLVTTPGAMIVNAATGAQTPSVAIDSSPVYCHYSIHSAESRVEQLTGALWSSDIPRKMPSVNTGEFSQLEHKGVAVLYFLFGEYP